mgnify:CR=1 FL=1
MSDLVFVLIVALVLAGVGLGVTLTVVLLRAEFDRKLRESEQRVAERALAAMADMVKTARADTAVNRLEDAIDAEARLWAMRRRIEMEQAQADVVLKRKKGDA